MTAERRLAKIEESLSPTQLVLRWLAEAHAFGDVPAYVVSLLAEDPPAAPLDRLAREAAHGARTSMRGKRPELVEVAVRSALRETVFRFELVMRINVTAHELLNREVLFEAVFASQLALLLVGEGGERLPDESHLHRLGQCRDLTALRVNELLATREACSTVEARYLDRHSALFPDIARVRQAAPSQSRTRGHGDALWRTRRRSDGAARRSGSRQAVGEPARGRLGRTRQERSARRARRGPPGLRYRGRLGAGKVDVAHRIAALGWRQDAGLARIVGIDRWIGFCPLALHGQQVDERHPDQVATNWHDHVGTGGVVAQELAAHAARRQDLPVLVLA
jgi:hypothetical protein